MSLIRVKLIKLFVISILEFTLLLSDHVSAAPQPQQEKKADLSLLINETLKINNKLTPDNVSGNNQSFRDDWTFDRVEYDLMDFLQELNARYRHSNSSSALGANEDVQNFPSNGLDGIGSHNEMTSKKDIAVGSNDEIADKRRSDTTSQMTSASSQSTTSAASTTIPTTATDIGKLEVVKSVTVVPNTAVTASAPIAPVSSTEIPKHEREINSTQESVGIQVLQQDLLKASTASAANSVLPISLASGDHDISESTWQYGIFDRFTRPRSSTTSQPADSHALSDSGARLDVRNINTDECGLRSYRVDPDYYPAVTQDEEVSKELSQRRQRPPLGSSFFSSHKKYHHTAIGDSLLDNHESIRDELDREKLLPPFDRYGERVSEPEVLTNTQLHRRNHSSSSIADGYNHHGSDYSEASLAGSSSDSSSLAGTTDGDFNLSSRRQWLQQQLGNTLQMLGFNSTSQLTSDILANQSANSLSLRENMMKMSGASKLGKSAFKSTTGDAGAAGADSSDSLSLSSLKLSGGQADISEKELKARQDELKLEARVIGGNDAHLGDSPWSVSLQALVSRPGTGGVEYRHYCGGTIISEYYILTAAHCLDFMVGRESRLFVVVGDLNWRMSAASMYGRRFGIEKLIIHGGYKSTAFGHDIGLIKTKESMKPLKVKGRYIINSVCLPERNVEHSGEAELVGWGLFSNRNEMADSLQIADVPILPRPLCVDLYKRRTGLIQWLIGIELITEKQVCAGTFGRGICQGDSGSALVFNEKAPLEAKASTVRLKSHLVRDQQTRATIIGVVAFGGIRRCSYQSLPGVYMQTSKYLDWILPRIQ